MKVRVLGAVVALAVLAGCTSEPTESSPSESGASGEIGGGPSPTAEPSLSPGIAALSLCDQQTPPEGAWRCGTIEVPLDHDDPSAGTIALNVHVLPHADDSVPAGAPVFTLSGGPGAAGFTYGTWSLPTVVNAHHDVVWLDQRGTGASGAIDCQDLQDGVESGPKWTGAIGACWKQLGDSAERYGSGDAALDLEAVRQTLGYDTVILEGQSYGSITTQAYAARFPDRVEAIVFDSGFPALYADHAGWFGVGYPAAMVRVIDLLCEREGACDISVPETIRWLARTVRADPVIGKVPDGSGASERVVVDEPVLATILASGQDGNVLQPGALERIASALRAGDPGPLLRIASKTPVYPVDQGSAEEYSAGANIAGLCADNDFGWEPEDGYKERFWMFDDLLAALPRAAFAPFSRDGWAGAFGGWVEQCITWPVDGRREAVVPDGSELPDVPTLILAGDVDTNAVEWAEELRATFPQATVVVVPGAGHNVLDPRWAGCTPEIVATFVDTLDPGDTACATDGSV